MGFRPLRKWVPGVAVDYSADNFSRGWVVWLPKTDGRMRPWWVRVPDHPGLAAWSTYLDTLRPWSTTSGRCRICGSAGAGYPSRFSLRMSRVSSAQSWRYIIEFCTPGGSQDRSRSPLPSRRRYCVSASRKSRLSRWSSSLRRYPLLRRAKRALPPDRPRYFWSENRFSRADCRRRLRIPGCVSIWYL